KPQTLYAYVSRGQLNRRAGGSGHTSLFHRDDVDRLAARGSARRREGRVDVHIDSAITLLDPDGRLSYRGADVTELAATRPFEEVAGWLWTGQWPQQAPWIAHGDTAELAATIGATLPATV